jgi:hypothetical protein
LLLFVFTLLSSCTEADFLNYTLTEPEAKLCLSGYICPDSTYVVLSLSQSYNDFIAGNGRPETISGSDATVVLFEDDIPFDTLISQSRQVGDSFEHYYVSRKNAIPGKTYTIYASYNDFNSIRAETYIPIPVQIANSEVEFYVYEDYLNIRKRISVTIYIQDTPTNNDYYLINRYFNLVGGNNTYNNSLFVLMPNPIFENFSQFGDDQVGRTIFFSDKLIQGEVFSFNYGHLVYDNEPELAGTVTLSLFSISEDYYRYELSRHIKFNSQYDANSNPVTIYSNVDGGYGIFMGFSESKYTVEFDGSI